MTDVPKNLKQYLQSALLVGDGAMATYLYQQGIPVGICYEELCLSRPDLIQEIHTAYYEAGARLIETNTFGANRERLSRFGLEEKTGAINQAAASLARSAVGSDAFVAGSIGAISAGRVGELPRAQYQSMYIEQASALLQGGVDALILETFLDLDELLLALESIRPLTEQPIICQLAVMEIARTRDGYTLTEAFQALHDAGADILGLNCRLGPAEMIRSLEAAVVPDGALLSAFPNAGRLGISDGEFSYKSSPQYFAESALRLREQGIRLIGGCCGTTPEHIKAIASALRGLSPAVRCNPPVQVAERARPDTGQKLESKNKQEPPPTLVDMVKTHHTVIVEFDPPRDLDIEAFMQGAAALKAAGADLITLADNSLATVRMSNMALGSILKSRLGIEPLVHIACRDRNLLGQQSHLMGLDALEIHHILVITGDPSRIGDLPGATSVYDITSIDLIRMIRQLNEGISFSGRPLNKRARFVVGAAFNPNVANLEAAVRRLNQKIEAGADFIMTQPVYDEQSLQMVHDVAKALPVPVFIGIMPITSYRNAVFLHNEVPGIRISKDIMERFRLLDGQRAREEGVCIAKELLDAAIELFNGIYLITPFSYYEMTASLTRYVLEKTKTRRHTSTT